MGNDAMIGLASVWYVQIPDIDKLMIQDLKRERSPYVKNVLVV